jgi:hypothetical protein
MRPRDFLPWREFTIETSWSPDVAAVELKKHIAKRGFFGRARDGGNAAFVGDISEGTSFRFARAIRYNNSFLPVIVATIQSSDANGARIRVRMRLHRWVAAFMCVWMAGAVLGSVACCVAALAHGKLAGLLAPALPLFGTALVIVPFAIEARIAERLLREIYPAAPGRAIPPNAGASVR